MFLIGSSLRPQNRSTIIVCRDSISSLGKIWSIASVFAHVPIFSAPSFAVYRY